MVHHLKVCVHLRMRADVFVDDVEVTPRFLLSTEQRIFLVLSALSSVVDILQKHNLTNLANETELYLYDNKTLIVHENQVFYFQ